MVAIVSFLWSSIYYLNSPYLEGNIKPFVYRALVPMLARGLEFAGIPSSISLVLVMTLSGVGFYLALRKLARAFVELSDWQELGIMVGVIISMLVLGQWRTPYDLMTALLFTLAFYYIFEVRVWKYLVVFTLACINRETAFLLIPISAIAWSIRYDRYQRIVLENSIYQVGIFVVTTLFIRSYYSDYPGLPLWIDPMGNLIQLTLHPYSVVLGILLVIGMGLWMFRKPQPAFLRLSFFILAPALLVMWVVCGQWSEPRVFWELAPVVILLMVL